MAPAGDMAPAAWPYVAMLPFALVIAAGNLVASHRKWTFWGALVSYLAIDLLAMRAGAAIDVGADRQAMVFALLALVPLTHWRGMPAGDRMRLQLFVLLVPFATGLAGGWPGFAPCTYLLWALPAGLAGLCASAIIGKAENAERQAVRWLSGKNDRWRTFMRHAKSGIAILDGDGRITEFNASFARLIQRENEDLRGCPIDEFVPDFSKLMLRELMAAGIPITLPVHVSGPEGLSIDLEVSGHSFMWLGQRRFFAHFRDITASRETERSLRTQERIFAAIMADAPDSVVLVDPFDLRFVEFNDRACADLGYTRAEFGAMSIFDILEDPNPEIAQEINVSLKATRQTKFEDRYRHKDGHRIDVYVSLRRVNIDERAFVLGFWSDISAEKAMRRELAEREQYQRTLIDNFPFIVWMKDREGRYLTANSSFLVKRHFSEFGQFVGKTDFELFPEDASSYVDEDKAVMERGTARFKEEQVLHDGSLLWLETYLAPVVMNGETLGTIGFARDITEKVEKDKQVRELSLAVEQSSNGIVIIDMKGGVEYANPAFLAPCGLTLEEARGRHVRDLRGNRTSDEELAQMAATLAAGEPCQLITDYVDATGRLATDHVRATPIRSPDGQILRCLGVHEDITEARAAEARLRAREREFRTLVENSPDLILRFDSRHDLRFVSPAISFMLGHDPETMIGKPLDESMLFDRDAFEEKLGQVFRGEGDLNMIARFRHSYDQTVHAEVHFAPEYDDDRQEVVTVLAIVHDVTDRVARDENIRRLAFTDLLTDLPNRAKFNTVLGAKLAAEARFDLMMVDLDRFKDVNDSLGHSFGDELLRQAAQRITGALGPDDLVARLGGDEFALILPGARAREDCEALAGDLVRRLSEAFHLADREVFVSASIGIVECACKETSPDDLMVQVDAALYDAKRAGRNTFRFHREELTIEARDRLALGMDLHGAQSRGEFRLLLQPKVDLETGRTSGAEALLRWQHPERGAIPPDKFIPLAEETGRIIEIGRWVIEEACRHAVVVNTGRAVPVRIALNLSPRQFVQNDVVATLRDGLRSTGCRGEWIEVEITESLLINDCFAVREALGEIHALGITVAIDDFGTGHAALANLDRLQLDVLKIDRSFVKDVECDDRKRELIRAFVAVARAYDLDVVAEGVEDVIQSQFLRGLGCKSAQGYLFGRPMPITDFRLLLSRQPDDGWPLIDDVQGETPKPDKGRRAAG
ncbi:PAS domain S-box protein [Hartmannibacter diazotrophicus]|uniref:PAS domain S-box protein n=1 Tax=Hartmannibacter diazotrophicus TaxID=1482074 RepID=UPI0012FE1089|nr:EAL domain-containing protein [Hartmannibacter diazotrophicus]